MAPRAIRDFETMTLPVPENTCTAGFWVLAYELMLGVRPEDRMFRLGSIQDYLKRINHDAFVQWEVSGETLPRKFYT
jgi:hypothetical protein